MKKYPFDTIEVVGVDMQCFKVRVDTLEPVSSSYYEPAAWRDPQGHRQMGIGEWQMLRNERRRSVWEESARKPAQTTHNADGAAPAHL